MHDYHPAVSPESWLASSERPLLKQIRQIVRSPPGYPPRGPRWPATGSGTQAATGSRTQGHAYFVYINIRSFQGAWRYAAESDWRLALGLRTAAIGILIGLIASLGRGVFVVHRWLGGTQIPWVNSVAGTMIGVSGTMLLGGLLLGAVLTGVARAHLVGAPPRVARTASAVAGAAKHASGRAARGAGRVTWPGTLAAGPHAPSLLAPLRGNPRCAGTAQPVPRTCRISPRCQR